MYLGVGLERDKIVDKIITTQDLKGSCHLDRKDAITQAHLYVETLDAFFL